MMLSEFKNLITDRINIIKVNAQNTFQEETAYIFNNWGNALSTTFYTVAYLIFLHVIYSNIKTFAGYSRNEMLLLLFMSQLGFYFSYFFSRSNLDEMIEDVRTGELDLLLTKPVPSLFYVSFKKIRLISSLTDSFAPLFIVSLLIDWGNLNISFVNLLYVILIFVLGQIALSGFEFLFAVPVFWLGRSNNIYYSAWEITGGVNEIPYEGFSKQLQVLFSTIVPSALIGVACTSVLLGKQSGKLVLTLSLISAILFLAIKIYVWKLALRSYTSASS